MKSRWWDPGIGVGIRIKRFSAKERNQRGDKRGFAMDCNGFVEDRGKEIIGILVISMAFWILILITFKRKSI